MAPEEEAKPESSQPQSGPRPPGRRDRRPSRGRRGRGRGGRPKPSPADPPQVAANVVTPLEDAEPVFELASDVEQVSETVSSAGDVPESSRDVSEPLTQPFRESPARESSHPAGPITVEKAIEEVSAVVESLRTSLEEMEEVLEMLELFERQKNADEREIESLRRAVRQMNRPRDGGHHHQR